MQKNKKLIIIGGGTAGVTIANRLKDHFDVTVIEKSYYKKYALIYRVPLMIGFLFRKKKMAHIKKRELILPDGRAIPFYESNLWGGASVMNGCVHVFGSKTKWQSVLNKFELSIDDLYKSNDDLYSFDSREKHKITLRDSYQNFIDKSFFETLNLLNIPIADMSHSEKVSCGPLQNTVRKYFRTSVLSCIKQQNFRKIMQTKVEQILFDESGKVTGVKTNKDKLEADYVILCAGVIGSCDLLLRDKIINKNPLFRNLPVGEVIQDHTNIRVNVLANKKLGSLNEISRSVFKQLYLGLKHFLGKSTIMRGTGATSAAYLDLDGDGQIETRIQILHFAETGRHGSNGSLFGTYKPSFSISITAIHPESFGTITLDGENNIVDPRFLSVKKDVEILKLAINFCMDLLKSGPIKDHVLEIQEEEYMKKYPDKYIHETMYSGHHLIGGLQNAVNSDFEVKNTKGLYVCDASIFDHYVASNIHSSVVLMADMFAKKFISNHCS